MINTAQVTPRRLALWREAQRVRQKVGRRYRLYSNRDVLRIAASGMGRGFKQTGLTKGEWDLAPDCHAPVPVQFDGAPAKLQGGGYVRAPGRPFGLTLYTKCRRCADCLRKRRNLWAYRAQEEMREAARTWFATFTLAPHWHAVMRMRASARLAARGTDLEVLPGDDVVAEVAAEYRRELTLYFKRLRKQTGAQLRYILVQEQHKSGLPHFHALIHETDGSKPVKHAALTAQWKLGYTKFKLVEALQSAWYVAKYLSKAVDNRVRASIRYGKGLDALKHSEQKHHVTTPPPNDVRRFGQTQIALSPRFGGSCEPHGEFNTGDDYGVRRIFLRQDEAGSGRAAVAAARKAKADREPPSSGAQPLPASGAATQSPPDPASREAWAASFDAVARFQRAFGLPLGFNAEPVWDGRTGNGQLATWHTPSHAIRPLDGAGLCPV